MSYLSALPWGSLLVFLRLSGSSDFYTFAARKPTLKGKDEFWPLEYQFLIGFSPRLEKLIQAGKMTAQAIKSPELPSLISVLAEVFKQSAFLRFLDHWQNIFYALIAVGILFFSVYFSTRKVSFIPGRLQNFFEALAETADNFVVGIIGPGGRSYTPFLGTLFLYILLMNILGLVPFMKSATASWSTTLALGICVFVYVQYTAVRKMGFWGYLDHLAGRPRGVLAFSLILPLLLLLLHLISELLKPISLSLRLRSNIWGDDLLLAVLATFGLKGVPLLVLNSLLDLLVSIIQAIVFCLLSTIYFALVLTEEK